MANSCVVDVNMGEVMGPQVEPWRSPGPPVEARRSSDHGLYSSASSARRDSVASRTNSKSD